MPRIVLTELHRTCHACPSQWEGRDDKDRAVYIRYRCGYLSVEVSEPGGEILETDELVYDVQLSDDQDGYLEDVEMKFVLNEWIDFKQVKK